MKITDVLNAPWAIDPAKLLEIKGIYETHLRGDKIDIAAVEASIGRPLDNKKTSYQVLDGVALLPIEGVMAKKMNLFSQISGGASTQIIRNQLVEAINDPTVHSVILMIDTPGGTVDGTQLLADAIREAGAIKPVVSLASGCMCSAGYWAGSAASKIYISDLTTAVGSIGVVTSHVDVSRSEEARGIKTTEITAGKYKRIASQYGPLTADGLNSIQEQLNYIYSIFVDAVAINRGVSTEKVLADMADGRVFVGQQAIDAGLVDGVSTVDALISQLNADRKKSSVKPTQRAGAAQSSIYKQGNTMPTAEQLAAEHPEAAAALRAEGASAERDRIKAIEDQLVPGHEALVNSMKFDGKSSAGDVAIAVLAAEKTSREAAAKAMVTDAPKPVEQIPQSPTDAISNDKQADASKESLHEKAKAYQKDHPSVSYVDAYKAVGGK